MSLLRRSKNLQEITNFEASRTAFKFRLRLCLVFILSQKLLPNIKCDYLYLPGN